MAAASVKDYAGGWASSYLQCLSRCGRLWRGGSDQAGRRDTRRAPAASGIAAFGDSDEEADEQFTVVKVSLSPSHPFSNSRRPSVLCCGGKKTANSLPSEVTSSVTLSTFKLGTCESFFSFESNLESNRPYIPRKP